MKPKLWFKFSNALKTLENPTYFSKRLPWLYWAIYNLSWADYYFLFDNRLAKSSIYASTVGYLIYLNDFIVERFGFEEITSQRNSIFGFSTTDKLHLLFFGLLLIASARAIFLWRRPICIKFGPHVFDWVNFGIQNFTYSEYSSFHHEIRRSGHRTRSGRYYDDDWEAFVQDVRWQESGQRSSHGMSAEEKLKSRKHVSFTKARETHEDLLRSILRDRYEEGAARRKISLLVSILLAIPGYFLFLLPNVDLTLTIALSILSP